MLVFDSKDPFPLLAESNYELEKAHSKDVDHWLGIDTERAESLQSALPSLEGKNLWVGLPPETLLTPYTEIREVLNLLRPKAGEVVVDLGAAYGRMAFVLERHFTGVQFVGYEFSVPRVREGAAAMSRAKLSNSHLYYQDMGSPRFVPVQAKFYFLYDFGSRQDIEKILADLRGLSGQRPLVVVGRGRLARDLIERSEPWLSQVNAPEHRGHYSIYRSAAIDDSL